MPTPSLLSSLSRLKDKHARQRHQRLTPLNALQRGFTLIELIVVLAVVGIISYLAVPSLLGSTDSARAETLRDTATKFATTWQTINQACGTSKDVTSSVTTAGTAGAALDLVFRGTGLAAAYSGCYATAGVRPLVELAKGTGGAYTVRDYSVSVSGGGTSSSPLEMTFTGVPVGTALPLYQRLSSASGAATATAMPTTADTTDISFRFTAPTAGGTTNITFRRVI